MLGLMNRRVNKPVLTFQMGDYPSCHHRTITQERMEADAEIHSQSLSKAPGVQLKRGLKNLIYNGEGGGAKIMMETYRDS